VGLISGELTADVWCRSTPSAVLLAARWRAFVGEVRHGAWEAEIPDLLKLTGWHGKSNEDRRRDRRIVDSTFKIARETSTVLVYERPHVVCA
jgi:hypothetical protein